MKYRDIEQLTQPLFDDEAFGSFDVFEIDAAKRRMEKPHAINEFIDIAGVDFEIDGVDIGKALEERAFPFHYRLCREGAEIPEPQNRGAVRDHCDEIALGRIIEDCTGLAFDAQTGK